MAVNTSYKPPATDSGRLRTPVTFFKYKPKSGFEVGRQEEETLFECFAEAYNPSMKDMEIVKSKSTGTKEAVTLNIRDTYGEYLPTNEHFFKLDDDRYRDKVFDIVDVAPDLVDNQFTKIVGGYTS